MNLSNSELFIFLSILVSVLIQNVIAIECYQCSSRDHENPFQCNEYMTDDIDISPQACNNTYGAAYCIKQTGRFEGGLGTKRFCSSLDLGNYCNDIRQPGDMLEYRSCVYTCSSDGCNGSTSLQGTTFFSFIFLIIIFIIA